MKPCPIVLVAILSVVPTNLKLLAGRARGERRDLQNYPITPQPWSCQFYDGSYDGASNFLELPEESSDMEKWLKVSVRGQPFVIDLYRSSDGSKVGYLGATAGRLTIYFDGAATNSTYFPYHDDSFQHIWIRLRVNVFEVGRQGSDQVLLSTTFTPQVRQPGTYNPVSFTEPTLFKLRGKVFWIMECSRPDPTPELGCRSLERSNRYDFSNKFPISDETITTPEGKTVLRFMVKAKRDAFLRLMGISGKHYEIDLNFSGKVSLQRNANYVETVPHDNVVVPTEFRLISVIINRTHVELYQGLDDRPILSYLELDPFPVRYVSFASMGMQDVLFLHACQGFQNLPPFIYTTARPDLLDSHAMPDISNTTVQSVEVNTPGCTLVHTFKYRFDAYFALSEVGTVNDTHVILPFSVIGKKDVHLQLVTSIPPPPDLFYEIDLDFFNHTNLDRGGEHKVVTVQRAGLLSPNELRSFVLRHDFLTGVVSITTSHGSNVFSWVDPRPFPLRFFSVASGSSAGNDTTWVFGCPDNPPTPLQAERLSTGCRHAVHTSAYSHSQYFSVAREGERQGNVTIVRFHVRVRSSGHIRFEPVLPPPMEATYEVDLWHQDHTSIDFTGSQVASATTGALLSADEFRGFWIRQDMSTYTIEVGRAGQGGPLVSWAATTAAQRADFKPFAYFSFATSRLAVNGTWLYGCKQNASVPDDAYPEPESDGGKEQPTMDVQRLKIKGGQPPKRSSEPIKLLLAVNKLYLDDVQALAQVRGQLTVKWRDVDLSWNPEEYNNIKTFSNLELGQLWTPEFVVHNGDVVLSGSVHISYTGDVTWHASVLMEANCHMEASHWPNDQHKCRLQLCLWAYPNDIVLMNSSLQVTSNLATPPLWDILSANLEVEKLETPWSALFQRQPNNTLTLDLEMRRRSPVSRILLLSPFLVLSALCLLGYWVRGPLARDKAFLGCSALILFVLAFLTLEASCPPGLQGMPFVIELYCWNLVLVTLSVVLSAVLGALSREPPWRSPPAMLCRCVTSWPVLWLLALGSEQDLYQGDAKDLIDTSGYTKGSNQVYVQSLGDDESVQDFPVGVSAGSKNTAIEASQYWLLLGMVCERITSLACWAMFLATFICVS